MSPEKQLQRHVIDLLGSTTPEVATYRVSDAGPGFPDLALFREDRHALVELKDLAPGCGENVSLASIYRPEQIAWALGYLQFGNRVYTLLRRRTSSKSVYYLWSMDEHVLKRARDVRLSGLADSCRLFYRSIKAQVIVGIVASLV